jgi:hypothetical protein
LQVPKEIGLWSLLATLPVLLTAAIILWLLLEDTSGRDGLFGLRLADIFDGISLDGEADDASHGWLSWFLWQPGRLSQD